MQINWREIATAEDSVATQLYEIEELAVAYASPQGACAKLAERSGVDEVEQQITRYECLGRMLSMVLTLRDGDPPAARFYRRHATHFGRIVFCLATAQRLAMGWPVSHGPDEVRMMMAAELKRLGENTPEEPAKLFAHAATRLPHLAVRLQHAWQRRPA